MFRARRSHAIIFVRPDFLFLYITSLHNNDLNIYVHIIT